MPDPISGPVDAAIGQALNGLATRQRVISNNVANVDTPGFKASQVSFEDQLQGAINRNEQSLVTMVVDNPLHITTDPATVQDVQPKITTSTNTTNRVDGNNVDIDKQMVELADTTLNYNALVQVISARLALTRYIVNEGRR